jgi:hypothetical protein
MTNSHRTLESIADRVPAPERAYDRLTRRRERKDRNRRIRAGTLALVVTVLGAAIFLRALRPESIPADQQVQPSPSVHADDQAVQPSPGAHVDDQPAQRPPIEGLEFPMLEGARPSTPITGDAIITFRSWPDDQLNQMVHVAIYDDGRVIWHPNQENVGFFQLRLTPAGVERIRSMIVTTGLFDRDLNLRRPGPLSRLSIRRFDRTVVVMWAEEVDYLPGGGDNPVASAFESRDLARIESLLRDPSSWQFSNELYEDSKITRFVPSGFQFDIDGSELDLSQLPSPARDLLTRYDPDSTTCSVITTEVARRIARALARAGFEPLTNDPVSLDWKLPGLSGPSNPHMRAVLPHELSCAFSA